MDAIFCNKPQTPLNGVYGFNNIIKKDIELTNNPNPRQMSQTLPSVPYADQSRDLNSHDIMYLLYITLTIVYVYSH